MLKTVVRMDSEKMLYGEAGNRDCLFGNGMNRSEGRRCRKMQICDWEDHEPYNLTDRKDGQACSYEREKLNHLIDDLVVVFLCRGGWTLPGTLAVGG